MYETQWDALAILTLKKQNITEGTRCLCSRVFIRYKEEKNLSVGDSPDEFLSCSDLGTTLPQKSKLKSDTENESVSCYCSASHTDTLSTDEHDSLKESSEGKPLPTSDSGTDLTDLVKLDITVDWQKFWSLNGEKLIWQSWITKYSAYINPEYLNFGGETASPLNNFSSTKPELKNPANKFSFEDNEFKTYQKESTKFLQRELSGNDETNNDISEGWHPLSPLSIECETEIEQLLAPQCSASACSYTSSSIRTVDSMTNVTRMTVSSIDFNRSPSDSLSSVSSVESSMSSTSSEEADEDNENQWNILWKKHYEEEYLIQYNNFVIGKESGNKLESSIRSPSIFKASNPFLSKHKRAVERLEKAEDTVDAHSIENIIANLKMTEAQCDSSEAYENEKDEEAKQMAVLGLPISFVKCDGRKFAMNSKNPEKSTSENSDFNSTRNKVKAAFSLLGLEFSEKEEVIGGEVDYKMKHIRLQNRLLKFQPEAKRPRHTYFDEDGKPILEESEEFSEENFSSILSDCSDNKYSSGEEDVTTTEQSILMKMNEEKTEEISSSKKRKRRRKIRYPPEIRDNPKLKKFWHRRMSLFSRFDEGIKLDEESWYSVTPEVIAQYTAERCKTDVLIDAFCGAGGNTIQFALTCGKVIAIDIDPKKIEIAKNNVEVYGVSDKVEFIIGDFLVLAPNLKADVVFMSPPWGGPSYVRKPSYDLEKMLQPVPFSKLMDASKAISKNVALFLPKNSNTYDVIKHAGENGFVEIEQNFINKRLIAITVYYNNLAQKA